MADGASDSTHQRTHMTYTHYLVTDREIESYDQVADLAHAVHGLTMLARGMGTLEVHTVSIEGLDLIGLDQLRAEYERKKVIDFSELPKADKISELSNIRQLHETIVKRIKEAK